jgi:hypothetical protein
MQQANAVLESDADAHRQWEPLDTKVPPLLHVDMRLHCRSGGAGGAAAMVALVQCGLKPVFLMHC